VLFKLLGAPFSLPAAGIRFVFNTIADLADKELNDESVLREQFLLLQVELEEGDIDDEEYAEREAVLLARLREINVRKRAQVEVVEPGELPAEANVEARRKMVIETPFDE
jgi:hypothetical protein